MQTNVPSVRERHFDGVLPSFTGFHRVGRSQPFPLLLLSTASVFYRVVPSFLFVYRWLFFLFVDPVGSSPLSLENRVVTPASYRVFLFFFILFSLWNTPRGPRFDQKKKKKPPTGIEESIEAEAKSRIGLWIDPMDESEEAETLRRSLIGSFAVGRSTNRFIDVSTHPKIRRGQHGLFRPFLLVRRATGEEHGMPMEGTNQLGPREPSTHQSTPRTEFSFVFVSFLVSFQ